MSKETLPSVYKAFIELCAEKNCDKITITDVAEKSGISRKTFYYHFSDMESLVNATVDFILADCKAHFVDYNTPQEILIACCENIQKTAPSLKNLFSSKYVGAIRTKIYNFLSDNVRPFVVHATDGVSYSEQDIDKIVTLIVVIIMGFLSKWLVNGNKIPSIEVVQESMKMFRNIIPFMISNLNDINAESRLSNPSVMQYGDHK